MMKRTTCILLLALLMFSCKQKDIWNNAKVENTILSYENYLKKYPEGKFSDSANFCIEELIWDKTSKENNISAYEEYLKQYPEGRYLDSAKLLRAAISVSQSPNESSETVKDIDGNVYKTLRIGTQKWMKENLKTTKYRNGYLIGTTSPYNKDISGETHPKYQWVYEGDESNVATYGRLYTWYAVTDSRNVCPTGWHVPTNVEWTILADYLGGYSVAGGKLKETGTGSETGFTALPGGGRYTDGTFYGISSIGCWWTASASEDDSTTALGRSMYYDDDGVFILEGFKKTGMYVRCLKN